MNSIYAKGFAAGQPMWMYDSQGIKIFTLIQNKASGNFAFTRGQVISRIGGNTGVVVHTVSTGTTTSVNHASGALVTNQWIGAILYLASTGSTAIATPEAESSIVISNTSAAINVNSNYPFSTTPGAGLLGQLISTYQTELSATGDLASVVMGTAVGQNGISTGNFGFVQSYGPCGRVNKDIATSNSVFTTGNSLLAGTATGSLIAATSGTLLNLVVGQSLCAASSVATDAMVFLNCRQMYALQPTGAVV